MPLSLAENGTSDTSCREDLHLLCCWKWDLIFLYKGSFGGVAEVDGSKSLVSKRKVFAYL
jgi:hypothetical protein